MEHDGDFLVVEPQLLKVSVVKEGTLLKKAEYMQTWRPRWFILKSDGSFRGYKQKPAVGEADSPVNIFDIQRSQFTPVNPSGKKGEKFGFTIQFMQLTRIFERSFHAESQEERDGWLAALNGVQKQLDAETSKESLVDRTRAMSFIDPIKPQACDISLSDFEMVRSTHRPLPCR